MRRSRRIFAVSRGSTGTRSAVASASAVASVAPAAAAVGVGSLGGGGRSGALVSTKSFLVHQPASGVSAVSPVTR